ncbi:MAG TPA: SIS domain-containing protein [Gemmatimonadales bacterium]|nr:SIS domain-containing protein [Gemmatimonadales bacterium]
MSRASMDKGLDALIEVVQASRSLSPQVAEVARRYAAVLRGGGTLFFCGNGGSAADAQHLAAEYVIRYSRDRRPLAAIALTTDSSILTAGGNDLGFERIFARQVEALCRPGDLLILHSTSGQSPNLVAAAKAAKAKAVPVVAWLGRGGGALASMVDESVIIPSGVTSLVQLMHMTFEHLVVEAVEGELFA